MRSPDKPSARPASARAPAARRRRRRSVARPRGCARASPARPPGRRHVLGCGGRNTARPGQSGSVRLPVVEEDGEVLGIVSIGDLAVARDRGSALADVSAAAPNT
ncbi:MAG: hypothetical protein DME10_25895 [Candidatus Rokuibacteriota bacterium]|nr:MAG: hypothetical protein DME10_25895 [Candidatus Rokubacteria bacterium]